MFDRFIKSRLLNFIRERTYEISVHSLKALSGVYDVIIKDAASCPTQTGFIYMHFEGLFTDNINKKT